MHGGAYLPDQAPAYVCIIIRSPVPHLAVEKRRAVQVVVPSAYMTLIMHEQEKVGFVSTAG